LKRVSERIFRIIALYSTRKKKQFNILLFRLKVERWPELLLKIIPEPPGRGGVGHRGPNSTPIEYT
jgi:hypothetical protein